MKIISSIYLNFRLLQFHCFFQLRIWNYNVISIEKLLYNPIQARVGMKVHCLPYFIVLSKACSLHHFSLFLSKSFILPPSSNSQTYFHNFSHNLYPRQNHAILGHFAVIVLNNPYSLVEIHEFCRKCIKSNFAL